MPRTPTFAQRFWGSRWPLLAWFAVCWVGGLVSMFNELGDAPRYGWNWLWLLLVLPLTLLISHLLGAVAALFIFGPIYFERGLKNGGPFQIGDTVQILCGPHKGKVTQVYQMGQHESVRLRLSAEAETSFKDIFAAHQLLREPTPAPPPADDAAAQR